MKSAMYMFVASILLWLSAGATEGLNQTLFAHYSAFKAKHPTVNDTYWNPNLSWQNKYKNYAEGDTRERFLGSKTVLVFLTDAYHATRELKAWANRLAWFIFALAFRLIWARFKYWTFSVLAISYTAEAIGFHAIYTLFYA
jgi:hypothetical protein